MQPSHDYMALQLLPFLNLAKTMDDKLLPYLLDMAVAHCLEMAKEPVHLTPKQKLAFDTFRTKSNSQNSERP